MILAVFARDLRYIGTTPAELQGFL